MDAASTSTFERARRRNAYRRLLRGVKGRGAATELLELDEVEHRLRPFSRRYAGIRSIPLDHIVGTDSRVGDFDREFLPQRPELGDRWRRVERAFAHGEFAPIVVNQLGDAYFVVDGHHRVAIARQQGREAIDAEVTELRALWQLHADADVSELIHAEQHRIFMEESGLAAVAPDACIAFSRPTGYAELLENVQVHGYRLMMSHGRALAPSEIAADWYERVYLAALETFRREGLEPRSTDGDLFLCVYERRRELLPECGPEPLEKAARQVLEGDQKTARARVRRLLAGRS
jgi:hypothetical protein